MKLLRFIAIPALAVAMVASCQRRGPDQTYTVRAVIESLPGGRGESLMLHHEAIPGFVGKDGSVIGMKEMIMPFPDLGDGVVVSGLTVGDPVEVVFEVRWNTPPRTRITSISRLPADAKLNFAAPKN